MSAGAGGAMLVRGGGFVVEQAPTIRQLRARSSVLDIDRNLSDNGLCIKYNFMLRFLILQPDLVAVTDSLLQGFVLLRGYLVFFFVPLALDVGLAFDVADGVGGGD